MTDVITQVERLADEGSMNHDGHVSVNYKLLRKIVNVLEVASDAAGQLRWAAQELGQENACDAIAFELEERLSKYD